MSDWRLGRVIAELLLIDGYGGGPSPGTAGAHVAPASGCGLVFKQPLPKWFRAAALAYPIAWQNDCLGWGTIGLSSTHRVALESIASLLFSVACFLYAARCLQREEVV